MKKILISCIIILCLIPALVFGYMRLLDTFIPMLLFPENGGSAPVSSNVGETERETVPRKKVVKLSDTSEEKPAAETRDTRAGIIAEILERSENLEENITVDIKSFSDDEIAKELLKSCRYYSLSWTSPTEKSGKITIFPKYKVSEEIFYAHRTGDESKLSRKAQRTYDIARRVIAEQIDEGMSDYEKALAIHDYLVLNTSYDTEAAKLVNAGETEFEDEEDSFTSFGVLFNKRGVCQAYSEAFNVFMYLLGIECEELTGEADGVPHSWNRIKLDGEYYHIDATWNDPTPDKPGEVWYAYFNLTDEMIAKDHTWERDDISCDSLKYNYYVYNGLIVESRSDFESAVENALENGEPYVEIKQEGFDIDDASFDFMAEFTGSRSFGISKAGKQNVAKLYFE